MWRRNGDIVNFLIAHYVGKEFTKKKERKKGRRMPKSEDKARRIITHNFFFRLQNVTKFKCGLIVIVALLLAIRKDAPGHCLQLLLYSRHCSRLSSTKVGCVRQALRLCFLSPIFRCVCVPPAVKSMTFDIIFIYSLLFFASFLLSYCSCRVVLLFFSFLYFKGRYRRYIGSI